MSAAAILAAHEQREASIRAAAGVNEDQHRVDLMFALELMLDVAYHTHVRDRDKALAVAAEAWCQPGYHDSTIMISHATQSEVQLAVTAARCRKHRRILAAEARGVLRALQALTAAGALPHTITAEAARVRWLDRGGHDHEEGA